MAECHVCAMRDSEDSDVLYRDGSWTALAAANVPGWVMLLANRHSEGWLWGLDAAEAADYGVHLQRLSAAIMAVVAPEKVYLVALGENSLHFHCLLLPRGADVPKDWQGPDLLKHGKDLADPGERSAVADRLRGELAAAGSPSR